MKIAFSSTGKDWESPIDPRFGRAEYFFVYNEDDAGLSRIDNRDVSAESHGAGPRTAQRLLENKIDVLVTGNGPGGNAASVLEKAGIAVYAGAGNMTVAGAYRAYKAGELSRV